MKIFAKFLFMYFKKKLTACKLIKKLYSCKQCYTWCLLTNCMKKLIFLVPCIMLNSEINPTRCNNCVYSSQWLYSTCFGWQTPAETYKTATRQKNQRTRAKMGHIYIPQPNDPQDNQPFQKHQHSHSIPEHKQENTMPGTTQTTW